MREVLTGIVRTMRNGYVEVHVGGLNTQEIHRFGEKTVNITLVDTHESLLKELVREVGPRDQRVKDLLGRIEKLVSQ